MAGDNTKVKNQNPHGSRPVRAPFRAPAGGVYLGGNEARRRLNVEQVRSAALSACVVVLAEQLRDLDPGPADGMLRRARPFLCAEDTVKADALLAKPQVGLQPVRWWMIKRRMWWLPREAGA
jgi:hypothetical protein